MSAIPDSTIARLWDSSVVVDYLAGKPRAVPHARPIVDSARRGEAQIWVSTFAHVEVALLEGFSETNAEAIVVHFFNQDYIVSVALDPTVSEIARRLVRRFRVKGKDAVHIASAIRWGVATFETFDTELIRR